MSTSQELANLLNGNESKKESYTGPTIFEGEEINQDHSPKRFIHTFLFNLQQNGFASANIIGMMGSGKTVLATELAHLAHEQKPELEITWGGADELRNLENFLNGLSKGIPRLVIFDDASNALDSLKVTEAAKAFEILTQGRHITNSQLGIITIYHYSFSHKKNFRSFAANSIYTSASPTEKGNILHMLRDNIMGKLKFKVFQNCYTTSTDYGWFDLKIGRKEKKRFKNSEPFRVCFVIGLTKVHLMVTKQLFCSKCSPLKRKQINIHPKILYEKMLKAHGRYGRLALSMICYGKGFKSSMPRDFREALDMASDLLYSGNSSFRDIDQYIRKIRKLPEKRIYTKKKEQEEVKKEVIEQSKEAFIEDIRNTEENISIGIDTIQKNAIEQNNESFMSDDQIEVKDEQDREENEIEDEIEQEAQSE